MNAKKVGCRGPRREAGAPLGSISPLTYGDGWAEGPRPPLLQQGREAGPSPGPPAGGCWKEAAPCALHLVGLSSPLGPGCQGLPWGQQAQEAPQAPARSVGRKRISWTAPAWLSPAPAPPTPAPTASRGEQRGPLVFSGSRQLVGGGRLGSVP